ncbi:hypothetical protein PAMC26510_08255 [Caballeronia sordidicola]|uniref:Uncharacterized protein n=1 Tax=Caballeronia sordidicola TaxID=196367 RepID=A0A242N1U4_CABSO|nr:hypothetical protein PAMC26510_08255 [Caballeronia sordidicola]
MKHYGMLACVDFQPNGDLKVFANFERRIRQEEADAARAQVRDLRIEPGSYDVIANEPRG